MNFVNRSLFLNTNIENPAQRVTRGTLIQRSDANLKRNVHAGQKNMFHDHFSGFHAASETESSEQYLWSAAWFVMFLLFLCTT